MKQNLNKTENKPKEYSENLNKENSKKQRNK